MARAPNKTSAVSVDEENRLRALALDIREKEISQGLRERELALRERELDLKSQNQPWAAWTSPTIVGIFVAAIGLTGNAVVAQINGRMTRDLEQQRGEYARVLEMIKVGTPDQAAENLRMLLDSGLYTDKSGKLDKYLRSRRKGEGAFLPTPIVENLGPRVAVEPAAIKILEKAAQTDAPWLKVALKEVGVAEVLGPRSNPRIVEYLKSTGIAATTEDIPWSSAFLNWVFEQSGVPGTGSAQGLSWETWGTALKQPRPGAIVIFRRGEPGSWTRHPGFYVGPGKKPKTISVLGGNTFNAVQVIEIAADRAVAYRWPTRPPP